MTWREYHDSTKHTAEALRRSRHFLDWANMPDPFRHYEGVPVFDLPAGPPAPEAPALPLLLNAEPGAATSRIGPALLSQLLFYSAAISASKRVSATGARYALRVNPSSGNLHPTEFHFFTRGLADWPDGLYHYRPSSHMAEQRARGSFHLALAGAGAPIVFVLTSIAWREAWKYRERAYRYCLLDIGHAWEAIVLAARAIGCASVAIGDFADDQVAHSLHLNPDEWPLLIVKLNGGSVPVRTPDAGACLWFGGSANRLSEHPIDYPLIQQMHSATKLEYSERQIAAAGQATPIGPGNIALPPPAPSICNFGEVARARRSALDFQGGSRSLSMAQLAAILAAAEQPFSADFAGAPPIQLYLYAHRIDDLPPGVYRHGPKPAGLELIRFGDQRVAAAGLSLGQDLAGNACIAFSMIADLERLTAAYGDRGYRYAHFLAGAIGQRLYLAAEALGLRATGIGAFFDEDVHRYLNLAPSQGQVIYHFAIGYAVPDPRLEG